MRCKQGAEAAQRRRQCAAARCAADAVCCRRSVLPRRLPELAMARQRGGQRPTAGEACRAATRTLGEQWRALIESPRELFVVYVIKFLTSYSYFVTSLILTVFLSEEFGLSDSTAGFHYGLFGTLITIYGFFMGFVIDNLGVRLSLLMGGTLMLVARVVLATTDDVFVMRLMLFGVLPAGEALGIPVLTLGIKRYTTDANRATAYGVYYSAMNVGGLLSGVLTDAIRLLIPLEACDPVLEQGDMDSFKLGNGADARLCHKALSEYIAENPLASSAAPSAAEVLLRESACEAVSTCVYQGSGLVLYGTTLSVNRCLLLSGAVAQIMMLPCAFMVREIDVKRAQPAAETESDSEDELRAAADGGRGRGGGPAAATKKTIEIEKFQPRRANPWQIAVEVGRTRRFWKFFLLTVLLINIKMIFRHLDATLPKWLLRTYGPTTPFGLLYSINPAIIIIAVPFVMALTQGFDPLKQIKYGALVAAISPFWITLFPNCEFPSIPHHSLLPRDISDQRDCLCFRLWSDYVQLDAVYRREHLLSQDVRVRNDGQP